MTLSKALGILFTVLTAIVTVFVEPIRTALSGSELATFLVTQVSMLLALVLPSPLPKKPEL